MPTSRADFGGRFVDGEGDPLDGGSFECAQGYISRPVAEFGFDWRDGDGDGDGTRSPEIQG